MRSRQMLVKLDRLDLPSQEPKCPDISLLSPAAQDRLFEQFRKNRNSPNEIEPTINRKVRDELERLLADLPILGPDDKPAGPKIEVPPCRDYGWREGTLHWCITGSGTSPLQLGVITL
jgi:hypothetical protein